MGIDILMANASLLTITAAAVAGFFGIVFVCWPLLASDPLEMRIRQISNGKRPRNSAVTHGQKKELSLKSEPARLYRIIVDRFDLSKQANDTQMVFRLRMAGYRGQGPVLTFLAARILAPIVLFILTAFYVFIVLKNGLPFVAKMTLPLVIGGIGYYAPDVFVKNRISKRQQAIRRAWPEALDLLLICVESGMSIEGAFRKVSQEIGGQSRELAEELALTTAELSYLEHRRSAYENLGLRTGLEGVRATVTSLIQAEKYGTSIGQSLRVLAQENRDMRMSEAEKMAASLPPKLTVPMIVFFLPVLFVVILTPAIIQVAKLP